MLDEIAIRKRIEELKDETTKRLGMKSMDEFVEAVGMKRTSFYDLINGKTRIVNRNLRSLAAIFDVSEEYLLLGYEPVKEEELRDQAFHERRYQEIKRQFDEQIASKDEQIAALKAANEALSDNKRLYDQILAREQKSE